jgi:hypothetical protein
VRAQPLTSSGEAGKEIEFDIEPTDTVKRIKERVEEKEGIPPPQQVPVPLLVLRSKPVPPQTGACGMQWLLAPAPACTSCVLPMDCRAERFSGADGKVS